jgi:hypothetical protein
MVVGIEAGRIPGTYGPLGVSQAVNAGFAVTPRLSTS